MVVRFYFEPNVNKRVPKTSVIPVKEDVYGHFIEVRDPRCLLSGEAPEFIQAFIDEMTQITLCDTFVSIPLECGIYGNNSQWIVATLQPAISGSGTLPPGHFTYEFQASAGVRPSRSVPAYDQSSLLELIVFYRKIREGDESLKPTVSWNKPDSPAKPTAKTIVIEKSDDPHTIYKVYLEGSTKTPLHGCDNIASALGLFVRGCASELGITIDDRTVNPERSTSGLA